MQEQALALALKIAGHVGHPVMIAVVAWVIAVSVLALALLAKRPVAGCFAAVAIIILGAAPYAASALLQSHGVYHVQVVVLRPDQSIVDIAQLKSSNGDELKMVAGGWELDIPPQTRPADGKVTLSASAKDEFMNGKSTLVLSQDYYPTVTIQLVAETSAKVRGVVVDEDMRAVSGATVSVEGSSEVTVTDQKGNFVLAAHAGKGQLVEVHARKDQLSGTLSAPAGKVVEVILEHQ